jgi:hypothetical protein
MKIYYTLITIPIILLPFWALGFFVLMIADKDRLLDWIRYGIWILPACLPAMWHMFNVRANYNGKDGE